MNHDGRFAPSPTGPLHMGSLRTALLAWLAARSQGARFILRIEDLDAGRCRPEHEARQLRELTALGLDWDAAPVRQSQRTEFYEHAIGVLRGQQRLYPCFCTRAEIRAAASAPHGSGDGGYPGSCRRVSTADARRRIESGARFALRLRADGERISWRDRLLGERSGLVDDFVLMRSDGVHSYQLAVVVDDAEQRIGEVVRGADLAESVPRQILLQRLLGFPTPSYAHVPLVLGPDGRRLAKRDRGATLASRREPPSRTLAVLAHSAGLALGAEQLSSPARLLSEFSLERIPAGPAVL